MFSLLEEVSVLMSHSQAHVVDQLALVLQGVSAGGIISLITIAISDPVPLQEHGTYNWLIALYEALHTLLALSDTHLLRSCTVEISISGVVGGALTQSGHDWK